MEDLSENKINFLHNARLSSSLLKLWAELRKLLGIAIVGVLIISQILTLLTTPVLFSLIESIFNKKSAKLNGV